MAREPVAAKDDGIRGKDYIVIKASAITVKARGAGLKAATGGNSTGTNLLGLLQGGTYSGGTKTGTAVAGTATGGMPR